MTLSISAGFEQPDVVVVAQRQLLVELNGREMRRYGKSRRALFEAIEREQQAMRGLGPAPRLPRM